MQPYMERRFNWAGVEAHVAQSIEVWRNCAGRKLPDAPRFTLEEQSLREAAYDDALKAVEREASKARGSRAERLRAQRRVADVFPRFASTALGLENDAIHLLTDGFLPAGTQFAQWATRFDPGLGMAATTQACRNAWTACGLQPLLGDPLELTPAIIGYSLLYPYSDNHLDHRKITKAEKLRFSARFHDRLCGLQLAPQNHRESAVWAMVRLIEQQYPREQYPLVFDCLLAIHRAQESSLAQLTSGASLEDGDVLRISCAKGGTSVLADACLSHGSLTNAESRFAFDWGVLLQLGDDLQDLEEDQRRGSTTLFTSAVAKHIRLDALVIQLLNFSDRVAACMNSVPFGSASHKRLLSGSWRSLIHMAVAAIPQYFSEEFLAELEPCSPFRFGFLRSRRERLSGRSGLYESLFDAFLEAGDVDISKLPRPELWIEHALPQPSKCGLDRAGPKHSFG
jgi:hypothetical protein